MKRTLRVPPGAEAEVRAAARWYEEKHPGLGVEFVAVVDHGFDFIVENPEACPVWRPDRPYRKHALKRFPYIVFFALQNATIEIVAVARTKRRPGYWVDHRS